MADQKEEKTIKDTMETMKKRRGYVPPVWAYAAEKDPDFVQASNHLTNMGFKDGKALPAKMRELIAIGILAFRGREAGVYEHIRRALNHGATKQEVLEALETAMIAGGNPTFNLGVTALLKIEEEDKKK